MVREEKNLNEKMKKVKYLLGISLFSEDVANEMEKLGIFYYRKYALVNCVELCRIMYSAFQKLWWRQKF